MKCPACQSENTKVVDTRRQGEQQGKKRQRRRECRDCNHRFNTIEVAVDKKGVPLIGKMPLPFPLKVEKRDGSIENFDLDRLMQSITTATPQAYGSTLPLEEILGDIQDNLPATSPIPTAQIGEATARVLADCAPFAAATYLLRHRRPRSEAEVHALLDEVREMLGKIAQ